MTRGSDEKVPRALPVGRIVSNYEKKRLKNKNSGSNEKRRSYRFKDTKKADLLLSRRRSLIIVPETMNNQSLVPAPGAHRWA